MRAMDDYVFVSYLLSCVAGDVIANVYGNPGIRAEDKATEAVRRFAAMADAVAGVRLVAEGMADSTSPEATRARAAAGAVAAEGKKVAAAKRGQEVLRVVEERAAAAMVEEARRSLAEAVQVERGLAVAGAPAREKVLAKGAVEAAGRELTQAEATFVRVTGKAVPP